jgi:hypothetical protein
MQVEVREGAAQVDWALATLSRAFRRGAFSAAELDRELSRLEMLNRMGKLDSGTARLVRDLRDELVNPTFRASPVHRRA